MTDNCLTSFLYLWGRGAHTILIASKIRYETETIRKRLIIYNTQSWTSTAEKTSLVSHAVISIHHNSQSGKPWVSYLMRFSGSKAQILLGSCLIVNQLLQDSPTFYFPLILLQYHLHSLHCSITVIIQHWKRLTSDQPCSTEHHLPTPSQDLLRDRSVDRQTDLIEQQRGSLTDLRIPWSTPQNIQYQPNSHACLPFIISMSSSAV